ncbi:P-loop containing nucleoside triphosphate hydrolase protein [Xylariaceae sp. FL0016]|nr:P-loop containing nucleoside triphosphate hydrolase protein [Xylariaceae sp. FL0016]
MMDFAGCADDGLLGPAVQGCRDDFDFTITFENIFFALIPASIFIALYLPRIAYLFRRPVMVDGVLLLSAKLIAITSYGVIQLAILVLTSVKPGRFTALLVSSSAVRLLSAIFMGALSHLEHSRSPRSSILLNTYLSVAILLQAAQTRTYWLASGSIDEAVFSRLFTTTVVLEACILGLESRGKSRWIRWDAKDHSPEESTGIFGLGAFTWLNTLFMRGYKRILTLSDLYPLDQNISAEYLKPKFEHHLEHLLSRSPGEDHGLAKALAKALAPHLLLAVGPRIAMGAFQFCQPFLISSILDYLQQPSASPTIGYGLIGATSLVYTGIAVSGALYWYFQERAMYMARGMLASAIYSKTVNISASADDSAALTLMSADVERVIRGFLHMHEIWANIIQVGLACWLLSIQIGAAFVAPLIVVGCCVVCTAILSRFAGPRQKAWMEKIQKRVGMTSKIIAQMKYLKMSGLAHSVEQLLQQMREDELETGARYRLIQTLSAVVGYTPLCISPVIAFAFADQTPGVTKIFTSISYIILLAAPLGVVFQIIPVILAAFTCLNRIQKFLEIDSRVDFRQRKRDITNKEKEENGGEQYSHDLQLAPAVNIIGGSFGWKPSTPSLKHIGLHIPKSRLTIVIGPIASGKTTLCNVLLGETPMAQGCVAVDLGIGPDTVGYCSQTPFLTNTTIKENIIGHARYDEKRYNEVIEASMLKHDFEALMQDGDQTRIGSNGITLSGGQKQRVAIARALYLDSQFFIFDDVLSGLDTDTEEQLYHRVFSSDGLLRKRNASVVLCTHSVRHLPAADHIVALGQDGRIVEQGTFPELMANKKYVHGLEVKDSFNSKTNEAHPEAQSITTAPSSRSKVTASKSGAMSSTPNEEQGRMLGDGAVYSYYFSRLKKTSVVMFILSGLGWGFFYNFATVWLEFWSKDVTSPVQSRSNSFYLGIYAIFQVSVLASLFAMSMTCFKSFILASGAKLHAEALRTVIKAPLRFFATTDTGIITNLFSQDMTLIDGQLPMALSNFGLYMFSCAGTAAVVAASSPYVVITYPFLVSILYGIQKFYLRTSRQIRLLDLEAKSPLYTHFIDTVNGITTIRALGWVPNSIRVNDQLLDTSQRPAYLLAMIQRWLEFMLQLLVAVLALAVVTLATQLGSNTAITGASLVTLMSFGEGLSYIVTNYTMLETSIGAVSRLKTFSDKVKPEDLESEDTTPSPQWPDRGHVVLSGVSASYTDAISSGPTTTDNQHLALKNIDLTLAGGEKVAICGRSGSGKSSFILLLLRILEPLASAAGTMMIDDIPLDRIDRATLRQRIIAVPQDAVFLPDGTSFKENLDIASDGAMDDDCRSVLEKVDLWTFVERHGGLGGPMHADTLSQGQKQLFSLARAVLRRRMRSNVNGASNRDGGVLLLDEVNSSVDQDTDRTMQEIIRREFEAYTVVMVSHRLDAVMDFDKVVVLEQGSVTEIGSPRVLVDTDGSKFRGLWMIRNR